MKFIHINMTTAVIEERPVPKQYAMLGGRGLTSIMINDLVPADCDPFGKENILIFAPGLLSGTPLVNTGRLSIGAKSPLTGGIKESNVGGTMALALARHGIRGIIVEGQPEDSGLHHIVIDEKGSVSLVDAGQHAGMHNYALTQALIKQHGDQISIACAGPAAERSLHSASIQVTDPNGNPSRAAARGGLGAVMASKGLKSLIVSRQGKSMMEVSDAALMNETARNFVRGIQSDGWASQVLPQFGTASILASTNAGGALPTRNARQGSFEGADAINGDSMARIIRKRGGQTTHKGCSKCIINCSNVYVDAVGNAITSGLEYETMWAMGAMIGVDDLDVVAKLDFLCDDIGLDTMNTGTAIAVAMDAGHLEFGDGAGAIALVEEVAEGTSMGDLVGHGPEAVGAHFNHPRVPSIKGQSIAGYDPRAMPGMGVTYATSPQGGDHTAGFVGGARGATKMLMNMSESSQVNMAAVDATGICMFAQSGGQENMYKAISAITGRSFNSSDWAQLGHRIMKAELDFNRRAGLKKEDNVLPDMFYDEPLSPMYDVVPYSKNELEDAFLSFEGGS
ncbi:aldehyde ferredoxin oxidoreductase C-terminal domain-containing protein [Desulfovibrio sp. JC022]|uniref:aldehyde ferredoxin oxidoreductase C-terminal domain-containing protein n=1 Tax=Desulfovibrio sp. JC022 TaxID=2593642 RepID=UPI0013D60B20|nr:aldehyde ferredoxin oxidoreductase C-terminal domain-containing protein [Desulfovibrio sp. JC022]NDV24043.1 aldehyde ferredoxin oxidoreductase [Desulfovibrio sp. JC022]